MSGAALLPKLPRKKTPTPRVPSARETDLTEIFANLLQESTAESLDQRRVYMLKCQQAQMERQFLIMAEAASQRHDLLNALAICVEDLMALCRQCIAKDIRGPTVPVERAQLMALIDRCRTLQGTLHKEVDDLLNDRYYTSNLIPNRFINSKKELKLRDLVVSSNGLAFLNLGRIRQLEGDLVKLYKSLSSLSKVTGLILETSLVPNETQDRYRSILSSSVSLLHSVSKDTSELSLLIPSLAPAPTITATAASARRASSSGATAGPPADLDLQQVAMREDIRRYLKEVKNTEAKTALEAKLKALKHEVDVLAAEQKVLQDELQWRQHMLADQAKSCNQLVDGLRAGYQTFRNDFRKSVYAPLESILSAYDVMEENPDNRSLKAFLENCKEHFPAIRNSLLHVGSEMAGGDKAIDPLFEEFRKVLLQHVRQDKGGH